MSTGKGIVMVLLFKVMALMVVYYALFKPMKQESNPVVIYNSPLSDGGGAEK
ncbi:MAG: hypothetical protein K2X53_01155 [Alphaproteobacteria bacterium]|nr:hypothetical protein [Alphaproteobacteria bacterium]